MSAPVYYKFAPEIRVDTPFSKDHGMGWDADKQAVYRAPYPDENPAGQLWERVAERDREVSDTYASERFLNAWFRSRVHGNDLARTSGGHYYAKANVSIRRSGIIRAGERVK